MESKNILIIFLGIFVISISFVMADAQTFEEYAVTVETFADNLEIPWSIAFAPDGRIFVTERVGKLRVIEDGELNSQAIKIFDVGKGEGGLLGLALDPNFDTNHYLYLYYTYTEFLTTYNKVIRYTENDNKLFDEKVLLDKIPGAANHDGGRLKFGPDGKLYITTGDSGNANLAQDLNSLAGKILRINRDGSIPDDNPFPNSPVFSYGHRNPQGLDWYATGEILVSSEHGSSAHDEINIVKAGKNYGWPVIAGDQKGPEFVNPILHTGDDTWAPSGAAFYTSENIPKWKGKYFIATLRGNHLRMLDLDIEKNQVITSESLFPNTFGRLRDASMGPDGNLYLLTSNRDGRGSPSENDDRILRIISSAVPDDKLSDESILVPLNQFKEGILAGNVICKSGLELLIKSSNGMPACVKSSTASILVERNWGTRV
jgi:aldose sugar dehydrogenase